MLEKTDNQKKSETQEMQMENRKAKEAKSNKERVRQKAKKEASKRGHLEGGWDCENDPRID